MLSFRLLSTFCPAAKKDSLIFVLYGKIVNYIFIFAKKILKLKLTVQKLTHFSKFLAQ